MDLMHLMNDGSAYFNAAIPVISQGRLGDVERIHMTAGKNGIVYCTFWTQRYSVTVYFQDNNVDGTATVTTTDRQYEKEKETASAAV